MIDNAEARQFIEEEFERWRSLRESGVARELEQASFVTAWARVAWHAEAQNDLMGKQMAKLQLRIGRQRTANRNMLRRLRELEAENERLRGDG